MLFLIVQELQLVQIKLAYLLLLSSYPEVNTLNYSDTSSMGADESKQVQVRAVFINCEPDVRDDAVSDNAALRFEREELFKHSSLRDCGKKLALTLKLTSESNQGMGDEYIPIDHVIEGIDKKRVRLLNPYVLCLRRETPQQAYKLRRVDTVKGVLSNSGDAQLKHKPKYKLDLHGVDDDATREGEECKENNLQRNQRSLTTGDTTTKRLVTNDNNNAEKRKKRSEHNIVVEDTGDNDKNTQWISKNPYLQTSNEDFENHEFIEAATHLPNKVIGMDDAKIKPLKNPHRAQTNIDHAKHTKSHKHIKDKKVSHHHSHKNHKDFKESSDSKTEFDDSFDRVKEADNSDGIKQECVSRFHSKEKDYAVYEIGEPDLWAYAEIQLFEKMINSEGKTVWNDLTKGKDVSVSSLNPEWKSKDMTVMYRPAEWLSEDKYALQGMSFCLLMPVHNIADAENATFNDYIVVPSDDILAVQDSSDVQKREGQLGADYTTASNEQCSNRVIVRTSRALGSGQQQFRLATRGSDRYLTMPYCGAHHAQIEVEAKADNNELIHVGASGRISTVVSDSTRVSRTLVTVQAANTGLAAARFRVKVCDCGPEITSLNGESNKAVSAGPFLLPPRHTRNVQLELPVELPLDAVHCSVQLVNDGDVSVAVRDLAMKRGDRCFCVWHCDCICMDDDPKLLCREMTEGRQVAAGLSKRELVRRGRSVCYHDVVYINAITIIFGVIAFLLFLGLLKACLGLVFRCIGTIGLSALIKPPRNLDCYYERSIAWRPVVYDEEGWPVHPDTMQRTVHVTSTKMEFLLNTIFFIAIPCVVVYESIKKCTDQFMNRDKPTMSHDEKIFNSQNMQEIRVRAKRRRKDLQKWMTPDAEKLSSEIILKGLCPELCSGDKHMKPLLLEDHLNRNFVCDDIQDSCTDSEQEDTEYVLMQMQKSKESLAKNQRKLQESEKPEKHSLKTK